MLRLFSAHLAVGRLSREYLRAHGVAPTSIYASPHAVDNDFFAGVAATFLTESGRAALRATHGCGPNDFVVLFAGKLSAGKRPIDAVRAVGRLGPEAVLVVAGSGERESNAVTPRLPSRRAVQLIANRPHAAGRLPPSVPARRRQMPRTPP